MKRAISEARSSDRDAECPICFESVRTKFEPFQCYHGLCRACDARMRQTSDNRCPVCRAPRKGMSKEDAEPSPERNHDPPEVELLLPVEFSQAMNEISNQALSFIAGSYGSRAGRRAVSRPRTGHVLFFRREAPTDVNGAELVFNEGEAEAGAGEAEASEASTGVFTAASLNQDQQRTFSDILGIDNDALRALLNIPESSIHDWIVMREQHATRDRRQRH